MRLISDAPMKKKRKDTSNISIPSRTVEFTKSTSFFPLSFVLCCWLDDVDMTRRKIIEHPFKHWLAATIRDDPRLFVSSHILKGLSWMYHEESDMIGQRYVWLSTVIFASRWTNLDLSLSRKVSVWRQTKGKNLPDHWAPSEIIFNRTQLLLFFA